MAISTSQLPKLLNEFAVIKSRSIIASNNVFYGLMKLVAEGD